MPPAPTTRTIQRLRDALHTAPPGTAARAEAAAALRAAVAKQKRPQNRAAVARYRAEHKDDIAAARAVSGALLSLRRRRKTWMEQTYPPTPAQALAPVGRALHTFLTEAELGGLMEALGALTPAAPTRTAARRGKKR